MSLRNHSFRMLDLLRREGIAWKRGKSVASYMPYHNSGSYSTSIQPIQMSFSEYDLGSENYSDSPPVVIMHGLFGSKSNWQSLSKALSKSTRKRVIALDARNHGNSPHTEEFTYGHLAEDIHWFVIEKSLTKICLIGHSMGGRAAMAFALKYPELIDKLVVVDISPLHLSRDMTTMYKYFKAMKAVKIDCNVSTPEGRKLADQILKPNVPDTAVRQFLLTNLIKTTEGDYRWRMNLDVLERRFSDITDFSTNGAIFEDPVLFVAGLKSDYLNPESEPEVRTIFPQAKFTYLDAGHWVHAERPSEFVEIVTNYLNE